MSTEFAPAGADAGTNAQPAADAGDRGGGGNGPDTRAGQDGDRDPDYLNGPWNNDKRFKPFYAEYKDWRALGGVAKARELQQAHERAQREIEQFRTGQHPEMAKTVETRDGNWMEWMRDAGKKAGVDIERIMRAYFEELQGGGRRPPRRNESEDDEQPWKQPLDALQGEVKALRAQKIATEIDREWEEAIAKSPYKGSKAYLDRAEKWVKARIREDWSEKQGKREPVSVYLKELDEVIQQGYEPEAARRRPAAPAPGMSAGTSIPPGPNRRAALRQQADDLVAAEEARIAQDRAAARR